MDGRNENGEGMPSKALILLFFFISISYADFLSVDVVEKEEPPPSFVYGVNYAGRIFSGGIDNFGGASARYRVSKHFATGAKAELDFSRAGFLADAFLHYLPSGNLQKELAENFLHFGAGYVRIEDEQSPIFSLGYGRDMLPWKKSPFGFRAVCRLELAPAAHIFSRKTDGLFGLKTIKLSNLDFAIELGVILLSI